VGSLLRCLCAGCGNLVVPNVMVTYPRGFVIDSIAIQTCASGSVVVPGGASPVTRTCTSNGWSGKDIVCES
jgi:hypothetical protein